MNLREAIFQRTLSSPRTQLIEYRRRENLRISQEVWDSLAEVKQSAVAQNDQMTAKAVWCLETVAKVQDSFVKAFDEMREGAFQEAWDSLFRCECETSSLDYHFTDSKSEFGVEHIRKCTQQYQELFPLKCGFSPGFLVHESRCSICNSILTLRGGCSHELGEIYDGEKCNTVVTKWELLEVSIVDNPADKSTMVFPEEGKDPTFDKIQELTIQLGNPWRRWSSTKEDRRTHHPAFQGIGRNEKCPCRSDKKYKKCCLNNEKVYPHFFIAVERSVELKQ